NPFTHLAAQLREPVLEQLFGPIEISLGDTAQPPGAMELHRPAGRPLMAAHALTLHGVGAIGRDPVDDRRHIAAGSLPKRPTVGVAAPPIAGVRVALFFIEAR